MPRAGDPRPAKLADHDWLINERGVATVEPFDGSQVHGVVWQLTDHDLATLDSAEGVPVRYRRDRLTVHTDDGPSEAWVYIDHRVEPGPPRPGYLERIVDGAVHHGLPHRWVEFLRRWDPAHWPRRIESRVRLHRSRFRSCSPVPHHRGQHSALAVRVPGHPRRRAGADDRRHRRAGRRGRRRVGVCAAPSRPLSAPSFVRAVPRRRSPSGSPSSSTTSRSRCRCTDTAASAAAPSCWPAGATARWPSHLKRHVNVPGYQVVTDLDAIPRELRGLHPDNPVNRVRGGGTQLELTPRVRGISPRSGLPGDDGLTPATSALVRGLVATARSWQLTSA